MYHAGRRLGGRQDLLLLIYFLLFFLQFELVDFGLDLRLELIGGMLELVEPFPNLAGDLRQLLGAKDQQSQHKDKSCVAKTHAPIITEQFAGGNATDEDKNFRVDFWLQNA